MGIMASMGRHYGKSMFVICVVMAVYMRGRL